MRKTLLAFMFCGVGWPIGLAYAGDPPTKKPATTQTSAEKLTYLGVGVEALPQALSSQLSGVLPKGEGVLIMQVTANSPAAKAGVKEDDIVLTFGGQKVNSPEQLVQLVRGDKPGKEVELGLLRGGKMETCKATLGGRDVPNMIERPHVFRLTPDWLQQQALKDLKLNNGESGWQSFDALKLTRLDDKRWRAEIDYRDKSGKNEHKSFEGTRAEIGKSIRAEKDMPANEQQQLEHALNLNGPTFEFQFPPFDRLSPEF